MKRVENSMALKIAKRPQHEESKRNRSVSRPTTARNSSLHYVGCFPERCHLAVIFILITQILGSVHSRYPKEYLIHEEVSKWCELHPYGTIYSYESYHPCSHKMEDLEELYIKDVRLKDVRLRVGIIPDKTNYHYDCGGYFEGGSFKPKPSYSNYILNLLQEILGFEVQFVLTDTWGAYDEVKKNWSGLVGLAAVNSIDLGICHTTITEDREDVVDFPLSTLSSTKSFVYDPSKLPLTRDVFVLTFSPMLWLSFFFSIVLLVLCFRLSTWTHSKLRPDHEPWSWIEVIMWANAAICQQSYSRHPKGSSCRTTFLIGYLITYLLYTGFAAGVTSLLAVQGHRSHIGFKDVVLMKLHLVVQTDGKHFEFIQHSPDPYARLLHSSMHDQLWRNRVKSLRELFSKADLENYIGLGTTVTLRNYLGRDIPGRSKHYTLSPIINSLHQKAFILPKGSPFKEVLNLWLLRLMEAGLLDFGMREYIQVEDTGYYQQVGWSSAGLGNVLSAVIIFGGGWFLSVFILFAEIAWYRKSHSSKWEIFSRREVQTQLIKRKLGKLR